MNRIRVLIVEDSYVVREFLHHIINNDPRLEVAAAVDRAEKALRILPEVSPDVISMDIRLPGMNGFEATRKIMAEQPTPIVVISASLESDDLNITMNALRAGALSVVEKPVGTTHQDYAALAERICTQLAIMSQVKVIRQRVIKNQFIPSDENLWPQKTQQRRSSSYKSPFAILGIVASTGGPNALVQILNGLPRDFPLPILLVQHISDNFLEGFVNWLNEVCPFSVVMAKDGEAPARARVYVAPPDRHLRLVGGCLRVNREDPVCAQRPSGTVLFRAMADDLGSRGLGVLLTGMGEDGAEGLLALREAGGYTLAEDESTAVVYGMPAAANRIGAVCETSPLHRIAPRIIQLTLSRSRIAERL